MDVRPCDTNLRLVGNDGVLTHRSFCRVGPVLVISQSKQKIRRACFCANRPRFSIVANSRKRVFLFSRSAKGYSEKSSYRGPKLCDYFEDQDMSTVLGRANSRMRLAKASCFDYPCVWEWLGPGGSPGLQNLWRVALRAAVGSTPIHSRLAFRTIDD